MTLARSQSDGPPVIEALLDTFEQQGFGHIFASPGSEWTPLWEAIASQSGSEPGEAEYWNCRHEALAVSIATGFSRASGRPAALVFHASVGPLAAAMQIRSAYHERVPLLILTGDSYSPLDADSKAKWLGLLSDVGGGARLVAPLVKWSGLATDASSIIGVVQHAAQIATSDPPGPVHVACDVQALGENLPRGRRFQPRQTPRVRGPGAGEIAQVAELLTECARPLIVTETAGRSPEAVPLLVELAERLNAPVVESQRPGYLNFPRSHPLHGGFDAGPLLPTADVVLLVGAQTPWGPMSHSSDADRLVILVDDDIAKLRLPMWPWAVDYVLNAAPLEFLKALLQDPRITAIDRDGEGTAPNWARDRCVRNRSEVRPPGGAYSLDVAEIFAAFSDALPQDTAVVSELSTLERPLLHNLHLAEPGSYFARTTGGLGVGFGTAIGVKLARREAFVVAFLGDGALNYSPALAAFGFLAEYGVPLLIAVFSNGYSSMKKNLLADYPGGNAAERGDYLGCEIRPRPDYASIAKAFGAHGERVVHDSEVSSAIRRAVEAVLAGRAALIEFSLDDPSPAYGQAGGLWAS